MIKVSDLLVEVTRVAAKNPDVKYMDRAKQFDPEYSTSYCRYEVAGNPACLIGVALNNLGISVGRLTQFDNAPETSIYSIIYQFQDVFDIDDREAPFDLKTIQKRQDSEYTWWDSIETVR